MQERLEKIVKPLLNWYQKNKRELPWREEKNPYHIWLSEIMLQQTRIEAVKSYYARFLKEVPTILELANIEEEKLLKLWEGLGYYNRARNLKKAAKMIIKEYEGNMPNYYEELIKLPGIGEYTAGAIASIAFDEKIPAVDGNVLRVISRVIGNRENVLSKEVKKEITNQLIKVIPDEAGNFNESLMELGEVICLPNGQPFCEKCPIQKFCYAYQKNLTSQIPVREKIINRKKEHRTVLLFRKEEKIAIQKRPQKGLLANMYEFPNLEGKKKKEDILEQIDKWGIKTRRIQKKGQASHIFSHIEWNMIIYEIIVEKESDCLLWVNKKELEQSYPMPTAFKKLQKWII